jgi:hypothetical protein
VSEGGFVDVRCFVYVRADDHFVPALLYSWSQDFLKAGGYSALLTRLNELLEVEWRYVCVIIPTGPCLSRYLQGGTTRRSTPARAPSVSEGAVYL